MLNQFRGLSSNRSLTWLACVPVALFGLGLFNLSAKAAEMLNSTLHFWPTTFGCSSQRSW